jgi:hypothetical protein
MSIFTAKNRTPRKTRLFTAGRLLASVAVLTPLLVGAGASAQAGVPTEDKAAQAATQYVRIEQVNNRWAMNTGFDNGTYAHDAQVQAWSWAHRQPHDWNSQWSWEYMGGEYYQYKNRWSGLCLDVDTFNFAQLEQNPCNASDYGQHWDDIPAGYYAGRDAYVLQNRAASSALGTAMVAETRNADIGSPVNIKPKNNNTSYQRWYFSYI